MKSPIRAILSFCALTATALAQDNAQSNPLASIEDQPGLPRVLLIGDSISVGYTLPTRELLKGRANVHRIPVNGGPTIKGLANIESWLGDGKWDAIHFNWGLHDLVIREQGRRQVEPEVYEQNLRTLVARLKTTGAKLIWATITPVPEDGPTLKPPFSKEPEYNEIAKRVMIENGVAIDDLNALTAPRLAELQNPHDVHFKPEAYDVLAKQVAASIGTALAMRAKSPLTVGGEAQVLADDYVIESMRGLVRRINPLSKHAANPVIRPDQPWEEGYTVPLTVFFDADEKLYRMWYRPGSHKFNLGYVISRDGITWDKPALGLVDYKGSRDNNQIALKTGPAWNGVLKDLRDPDPARRYKLLAYNRATNSNGLFLFVSPDGLNWSPHSDKPLLEGLADCHNLMGWDARISRYVAYVRPDKPVRTIARITSEDMVHWTPMQTVLEPDEDDPPGTQFYGMSVFPDRGVYYGLLWVYHPNELMIDTQLAFSRDGIQWERAGRRHPILSYGLPNQFDSHVLLPLQPILEGDELKVYYFTYDKPHPVVYPNEAYPPLKAAPPKNEQTWLENRRGYTGLATCRRDRFVSLDAGALTGELVSKVFKLEGSGLILNADASRGEIKVEVDDEDGRPLTGFAMADSNPVRGDAVRLAASWKGQKDLSALKGRNVKLRVQMRNARLYSFQVLP